MNLEEFEEFFLLELTDEALFDHIDCAAAFVKKALAILSDRGEMEDYTIQYFGKQGKNSRIMQFDAYSVDFADNSFSLYICDFMNSQTKEALNNSRIETLYKRMQEFLTEANNGDIKDYCDDSDFVLQIAREFKQRLSNTTDTDNGTLNKLKFYILTNSRVSNYVKTYQKENFLGCKVEVNIWGIERFFENLSSSMEKEPIFIDIIKEGFKGIPCIKADMQTCDEYDAYLAIIPALFLSNIYLKYGSRLLEGNVRSFLSSKGTVNKGIRSTILGNPKRFFAYNNGIAATAKNITLSTLGSGLFITEIEDLQIINGGQTTASIASAFQKDKNELKEIFVPMKIILIKNSDYQEMIEHVAQYANSQNKVTEADFESNKQFHRKFEEMSKRYLAPALNGSPLQTYWFYERARGQYQQEQMKMTKAERARFQTKHPKHQLVKKEELAKYMMALKCKPYLVSKGQQACMKVFSEEIVMEWEKSCEQFNEFFFRKAICAAIIFKAIDELVAKQPWYVQGGYKSHIVGYTFSKIMFSIPSNKSLDFDEIWKNQQIQRSFIHEVEVVSKITNDFIMDSHGMIVMEYCKRPGTWEVFKTMPYEPAKEFLGDLIDSSTILGIKKEAAKEQKMENGLNLEMTVVQFGGAYWQRLIDEGLKANVLNPTQVSLLQLGASLDTPKMRIPTSKQAKAMMDIRKTLGQEGISI